MSARLRRFTPGEVLLTGEDAHRFLRFFSINPVLKPEELTMADRAFVQALLVEAIDTSYDMGYVAALFNAVGMKPFATLTSVGLALAQFAVRAAAHWFTHATATDLKNPQIYESVRLVMAQNWATVWQIRLATGRLTY
jgi:hypothetical protein